MMIVGRFSFCDFQTIQEAVHYIERHFTEEADWVTLYILEGVYQERIVIKQSNISLIGLGHVIISNGAYAKQRDKEGREIGTFETATLYLDGKNVHLENLTIENTAGQGKDIGQAVALYANCDDSTFKNCRLLGHQDTLFTSPLPDKKKDGSLFLNKRPTHSKYHQYYDNCFIEGTVDFIFGGASAYFNRCVIKSREREEKALPGYITAASTPKGQAYGFIFNQCVIMSENLEKSVYLGRPWRPYAKVRFQKCKMDDSIHIDRWHDWGSKANRKTITFEEFQTVQNRDIQADYLMDWTVFSSQEHVVEPENIFSTKFYTQMERRSRI